MGDLGLQIRHELGRYLSGRISLREFRDWFLPSTWNVDKLADRQTAELAHDIELLLSEYEHGHWLEAEVRDRLAAQLTGYFITFGAPMVTADSSSSTQWAIIQIEEDVWRPGFADIRPEGASV